MFSTDCTAQHSQSLNKTRTCTMKIWIHIFLLIAPKVLAAVRLQCGNGTNSMELVENATNFTLTCDGYDHLLTVIWQRKNERNFATINIGNCNSSTCTLALGIPSSKMSLTYVSSTSSRVTSSFTARNDDGDTYLCANEACKINIMHPPTDVRLTLNNHNGNLTIEEGQYVAMRCLSDGNPQPNITINDTSHNKIINSPSRAVVNSTNTELVHIITSSYCQNTTTYRCIAKNSIGQEKESYAALFVLCAPRKDETVAEIPTSLDYRGQAISFTFTVIAYPKPENTQQQCYNSKMVNVTQDKCTVTCTVTNFIYKSKCDVIIDGITSDDAGIFKIRLQNDLGFAKDYITFNLTVNAVTISSDEAVRLPVGVETAITLTVVCSLGFIAFMIWRRKWILQCSVDKTQNSYTRSVNETPEDNIELSEANAEIIAQAETFSNASPGTSPQSEYDALQIQEVGMKSTYDTVNYTKTSKDLSVKDRLDHEQALTDQPVYSNVPRKS